MILAELDALIEETPGAAMVLASAADWFALFGVTPDGVEVRESSQVVYRGLPVWVAMPGETRVLSEDDAKRDGFDLLGRS